MTLWFAQASGNASEVAWNDAADGSGNALTWPAAAGDTLHSNENNVNLDVDPGNVTLDAAGWHVVAQVNCVHGLDVEGTVNVDSGGVLILGTWGDPYTWTINGTVRANGSGHLQLGGGWTINGTVAVGQYGTAEVWGTNGTVTATGTLTVALDAHAFTFGGGTYNLHADSTVTLFGHPVRPTQAIAAAGDVREGVATGRTMGTFVVPAPGTVQFSVHYGAEGTEFEGMYVGAGATPQEIWGYSARSLTDKTGFSLQVAPPTTEQISAKVAWDLGAVHGWDLWSVRAELAAYHTATREDVAAVRTRTDLIPAQPAAVGSRMGLSDGAITAAAIVDGAISSAKFTVAAIEGPAAGILEQVRQLWRRFFKRSTMTASQLKTYADDGTTVVTTQALSDDGVTQTQGPAL